MIVTTSYFNSAIEMQADTSLNVGDIAITLGYYEPNDGGGATYKVVDDTYNNVTINQKFALIYTGSINLQSLGAKNDASILINCLIDQVKPYCQTIELNNGIYLISTDWYRDNLDIKYIGNGYLKFDKWIKSISSVDLALYNEGCYIPYLNDDIYTSMHLPSEVLRADPGSWKITSYKHLDEASVLKDGVKNIVTMCTLDTIKDVETIPDVFTVCIGDCTLYGYTGNKWTILTTGLQDIALYTTSFDSSDIIKIDESLIQRKDSHIEITLSKDLWYSNNVNRLLHWWTNAYTFTSNDTTPNDFQAYIAIHEVWIKEKEKEYENIFAATCGIDIRGDFQENTLVPLEYGSGRVLKVTCYKKNILFNTLTQDLYTQSNPKEIFNIINTKSITHTFNLYNHHINYSKTLIIPYKSVNTPQYGMICKIKVSSMTRFSLIVSIRHMLDLYYNSIGGAVEIAFMPSSIKQIRSLFNNGLINKSIFAIYNSTSQEVEIYIYQNELYGAWGTSIITLDIMGGNLIDTDPLIIPSELLTRDLYNPTTLTAPSFLNQFWIQGEIPTDAVILDLTSRPNVSTVREGYMSYDYTLKKPIWFNGTSWIDANGNLI